MFAACTGGSSATTTTAASTTTAPTTSTTTTTTTRPPTANGPPIASIGDTNATTRAVQFLMNCAGYGPVDVDGAFGPATKAAVEVVQADLGREETGAPDDQTLALLARACGDSRRLTLDTAEFEAVGNVSAADPDTYFLRAEEGQRVAVVVTSVSGGARVDVRGTDNTVVPPAAATAWAADIPTTQDYVVSVSTAGDATRYTVAAWVLTPGDGAIKAAGPDSVVVAGASTAVSNVCMDTTGETSYVATTGGGHLVVTLGAPGSYAWANGGIGGAVEFVYTDGSPGWIGFPMDLSAEVGDRITGSAWVYAADGTAGDEPVSLAFDLERSAAPCSGGSATSIVLTPSGLGVVDFGADPDETIQLVREAMPGASPTQDTGWVDVASFVSPYGACRDGTSTVRVVTIDNLILYFTDAKTSWAARGTRHFAGYEADEGVFPLLTGGGVGPGATIGEVLAVHPDAGVGVGLGGGAAVYVTAPVGWDGWLLALAPDAADPGDTAAVVAAVRGGRFCDG